MITHFFGYFLPELKSLKFIFYFKVIIFSIFNLFAFYDDILWNLMFLFLKF